MASVETLDHCNKIVYLLEVLKLILKSRIAIVRKPVALASTLGVTVMDTYRGLLRYKNIPPTYPFSS